MRNIVHLFVIAAIAAAFASPALAQDTGSTVVEKRGDTSTEIDFAPAGTADLDLQMLRDFSGVKQDDPAVAQALASTPSLVESREFVQKHPGLQAFLDKYPDARHQLETNPGNFLPTSH